MAISYNHQWCPLHHEVSVPTRHRDLRAELTRHDAWDSRAHGDSLRVGLLVAAAVALALAASQFREKRSLAIATVDDIEAQLAALDPVTKAAVVARLSTDAVKTVHDKRGSA